MIISFSFPIQLIPSNEAIGTCIAQDRLVKKISKEMPTASSVSFISTQIKDCHLYCAYSSHTPTMQNSSEQFNPFGCLLSVVINYVSLSIDDLLFIATISLITIV